MFGIRVLMAVFPPLQDALAMDASEDLLGAPCS